MKRSNDFISIPTDPFGHTSNDLYDLTNTNSPLFHNLHPSNSNETDTQLALLQHPDSPDISPITDPESNSLSSSPNTSDKWNITIPHSITNPSDPNIMNNQKYTLISFLPKFLFEQFKYFFNLYFLLVALSQLIPALQIGLIFSSVAPLVFV